MYNSLELTEMINQCNHYKNNSTAISKHEFKNQDEKEIYIEKCIMVELYEAINAVNSWKIWKKNLKNDLREIYLEVADVYIFMMDLIKPSYILKALNGNVIVNPLDNYNNLFININQMIYENIISELIANGDISSSRSEFMNDVIKYIMFKINYNMNREDHKNGEI